MGLNNCTGKLLVSVIVNDNINGHVAFSINYLSLLVIWSGGIELANKKCKSNILNLIKQLNN